MSEASYQRKVIAKYEKLGYYVLKLIRTNKNGIPDLLCIKTLNKTDNQYNILFIEVKGKDTVVSKIQHYRMQELLSLGINSIIDREP